MPLCTERLVNLDSSSLCCSWLGERRRAQLPLRSLVLRSCTAPASGSSCAAELQKQDSRPVHRASRVRAMTAQAAAVSKTHSLTVHTLPCSLSVPAGTSARCHDNGLRAGLHEATQHGSSQLWPLPPWSCGLTGQLFVATVACPTDPTGCSRFQHVQALRALQQPALVVLRVVLGLPRPHRPHCRPFAFGEHLQLP